MRRLTAKDYAVDAVTAAKALVGAWLCRRLEDGSVVRRRITETEAYCGEEDTACHAHKGRTARTDVMYSSGLQARPKPQVAVDTLQIGMHMEYIWKYKTPGGFDDLVMCGDGEALTGLWFEGSRDDWCNARECERRETPAFRDTCRWLDEYFAGHDPGFTPNYRIDGLTPFRQAVIDEMLRIPYGATVSYGRIAKAIEKKRGGRASAQAVGGAVGWNPICIIIPCHRVIGADGSLTGYGGGLNNKMSLLMHEGVDVVGELCNTLGGLGSLRGASAADMV